MPLRWQQLELKIMFLVVKSVPLMSETLGGNSFKVSTNVQLGSSIEDQGHSDFKNIMIFFLQLKNIHANFD